MPLEAAITTGIRSLKALPFGAGAIACAGRGPVVELLPFGADAAVNDALLLLLSRWRQENIHAFPKIFPVTMEGTRIWARRQLVERPDRLLFFVRIPDGRLVGHVGLSSFDPSGICEIDNIVRGVPDAPPGAMAAAVAGMMEWAYRELRVTGIGLRVMHDNVRALALYHRLGFVPKALEPLRREENEETLEWVPCATDGPVDRFYLAMRHIRREPTNAVQS